MHARPVALPTVPNFNMSNNDQGEATRAPGGTTICQKKLIHFFFRFAMVLRDFMQRSMYHLPKCPRWLRFTPNRPL